MQGLKVKLFYRNFEHAESFNSDCISRVRRGHIALGGDRVGWKSQQVGAKVQ